ncbi:hypothetical protein AAH037_03890 [Phocaeicola vulgatus]|jgi:hypothetical protein|uniref:hypothetical protein n=1 Tax=Phocaeicola vulgatus TaxID=821 RepID=UPI0010702325|nr:hypothetical protein E1J05_01845 [Phocaeicola dorei]TDA91127.1 hypothetical protein E1J02_03410 [Phocaeicola dorei]
MKDKLLFLNTYKSKRSNGVNRAYWTKYIRDILSENELEFLFSKKMDSYCEQMPIFSCLVKEKKRGLVIYQYNPSLIKQEEISYERYMTAWVSQRVFHEQRIYILTIYLIPSQKNIETSKNLIKAWFERRKDVKRLIEKIYESQNTP